MSIRAHRFVAAGALGVAAVAAPIAIALVGNTVTESVAGPACLAWYGNQEDGVCLSYSNGNGVNVGSPGYSGGNGPHSGLTTGPILPGQTWKTSMG
jgi:hypothetical protein